jgi:phosphoribosylformylglycinamidine synthase II
MISRIYVTLKGKDNRAEIYKKSWNELGLSKKVTDAKIVDSYLLDHDLSEESLRLSAKTLTNPTIELSTINRIPVDTKKKCTYAIEIGFLPGVTDNVGHTTKETIMDLLRMKDKNSLEVYTSKVFLVYGPINMNDAKKIALSLHNPLIERSYIASYEEIRKVMNLPLKAPEVVLADSMPVIDVDLNVGDEELGKIGTAGVLGEDGKTRRGPLALDLASMHAIKAYFKKLGRNPTDIELESLAQTWSEHCKHTIFANPVDDIKDGLYKTYIKGATNLIRKKKGKNDFCVSVFSDNSGGVVFDDNYLITHKVETHNSPSALDPYGGAITGIVGVNRDTLGFGLGAKPIANVYGFCVGDPFDTRPIYRDQLRTQKMFPPKRIMDGVIKGVNAGGNTSGIPTLNGFIKFDDGFKGKPLVFAGTVGLIPRKIEGRLSHEKEALPGDYIVVAGGRVGADGIHGATFSSVAMDSGSPATAVQIGDPITQKKLSDVIVKEARYMNLYSSITDNGAGGISCSVAEMAKECGGAVVELEKVPLKYPGLKPWEIWISESQERMTLAVPKKKWELFHKLMEQRGVEATVIGEFTSDKKCIVKYQGKKIMDMDMEFLHNGLPKHPLKTEKIAPEVSSPVLPLRKSYNDDLLKLVGSKNLASFAFISEQYDHEVQASSVLKPISGRGRINTDAQVLHPVLNSLKGAVLSSSLYPSYGNLSTYDMSACAIDTAIRNIICAGGTLGHLSILDNFCWCSSYDKARLWQLVEAVRACFDTAVGYGTPFISGKDSMFNDFKGYDDKGNPIKISIPPTLLISAISVIPDVRKTVSPEFKNAGDIIYLLGETKNELGGGEYLKLLGLGGGNVPKVDIKNNIRTYSALEEAIQKEILSSAISVSSGGLATSLAKASIGGKLGAKIDINMLPGTAIGSTEMLFSESQGRILVTLPRIKAKAFEKIMNNIPHVKLGTVSDDAKLEVNFEKKKLIELSVKKLDAAYHSFSNLMK